MHNNRKEHKINNSKDKLLDQLNRINSEIKNYIKEVCKNESVSEVSSNSLETEILNCEKDNSLDTFLKLTVNLYLMYVNFLSEQPKSIKVFTKNYFYEKSIIILLDYIVNVIKSTTLEELFKLSKFSVEHKILEELKIIFCNEREENLIDKMGFSEKEKIILDYKEKCLLIMTDKKPNSRSSLNLDNSITRIITQIPRAVYSNAFDQAGVNSQDVTQMIKNFSMTSKGLYNYFKPIIPTRKLQVLMQAIVDNDDETVKLILDSDPELLLPRKSIIINIKSDYTHQQFFFDEDPMSIAVKRRQLEMIKLMLPYYDKIKDQEAAEKAKTESLSKWKYFDTKINKDNKEEIIIPGKYTVYMQEIIDVIKEENGDYKNLNKTTDAKLKELFNRLLPEKFVKLDDYDDIEMLLLGAYTAYRDNFDPLSSDQLQIFAIRVIGLIQTMLPPELAKLFCLGIADVVEKLKQGKEIKMTELAAMFKLKGGENFYRERRDLWIGPGFDRLCNIFGGRMFGVFGTGWDFLCRANTSNFQNLCKHARKNHLSV